MLELMFMSVCTLHTMPEAEPKGAIDGIPVYKTQTWLHAQYLEYSRKKLKQQQELKIYIHTHVNMHIHIHILIFMQV
jgi:hypothetical protein